MVKTIMIEEWLIIDKQWLTIDKRWLTIDKRWITIDKRWLVIETVLCSLWSVFHTKFLFLFFFFYFQSHCNDREEIRRKLAMGGDEDLYNTDRLYKKANAQSRYSTGMNLQLCFMSEKVATANPGEVDIGPTEPASSIENVAGQQQQKLPSSSSYRNFSDVRSSIHYNCYSCCCYCYCCSNKSLGRLSGSEILALFGLLPSHTGLPPPFHV